MQMNIQAELFKRLRRQEFRGERWPKDLTLRNISSWVTLKAFKARDHLGGECRP